MESKTKELISISKTKELISIEHRVYNEAFYRNYYWFLLVRLNNAVTHRKNQSCFYRTHFYRTQSIQRSPGKVRLCTQPRKSEIE